MVVFRRKEGCCDLIPVARQQEPTSFEALVRSPGRAFLALTPNPTGRQFKQHQYWRRCLNDLWTSYSGVCSYSGIWINRVDSSVDHFIPKSTDQQLAYEWDNYRHAHKLTNKAKANALGILDPFNLAADWFVLDFDSFFVLPNVNLTRTQEGQVRFTIRVLDLNSTGLVDLRRAVIKQYSVNSDLAFLDRRYPFVAYELRRQGRTESIKGAPSQLL